VLAHDYFRNTDEPCLRTPSDPNQSYLGGHARRIELRYA